MWTTRVCLQCMSSPDQLVNPWHHKGVNALGVFGAFGAFYVADKQFDGQMDNLMVRWSAEEPQNGLK